MKWIFLFLILILFGAASWLLTIDQSRALVFARPEKEALLTSLNTPRVSSQPVELLFGGDMMLDRYIRTVMNRKGSDYILASLRNTLSDNDMVIANLEGPITNEASVSEASSIGEAKNYIFTFPPESAAWLNHEGISAVNLGNNHLLNFGREGARSTEDFLIQAGVGYFGSPVSEERTLVQTIRGVRVGFVNYNQFIPEGKVKALADIAKAKDQVDVVILYTHWGKEYAPVLPSVRELAHEFIDVGVDVIIGSHPHVVQEKEVYQGKTIYYSLGNFVFDQYQDPATQQGLLVKLRIDPSTKELAFEELPLVLNSTGQTVLATTPSDQH